MRRVLFALAFVLALPVTVTAFAAPVNEPVSRPRWVTPIDSRTTDQWLSESAGVVYGARAGRLVAIDLHSGGTRWIAKVAVIGRSASGGGFVAAPSADAVSFIDARNGRVAVTRQTGESPGVASYSTGFVTVVAHEGGITVARAFSFDGTPRWTKQYRFGADPQRLVSLGGDALVTNHGQLFSERCLVEGLLGQACWGLRQQVVDHLGRREGEDRLAEGAGMERQL